MNILRTNKNFIIIAFLLSLLFHGSTIFYIFTQKLHTSLLTETKNTPEKLLSPLPTQPKPTEWVETRAQAGNFGAPVFFEDEPETFEIKTENTAKKDFIEAIKNEIEDTPKEILDQEKNDIFEVPAHRQETTEKTSPQPQELGENNFRISTPVSASPSKIVPPKKILPKRTSHSAKQNEVHKLPQPSSTAQPPITLAELTQGFLSQSKKNAGTHKISLLGTKKGLPSNEQMKYERYIEKLCWYIQNSFHIHRYNAPMVQQSTSAEIFFSLDRNGHLKNIFLKKSSGNMHIDQFLLFIFRDASQSFPPVPSYLPDNPFNLTCFIPLEIDR